MQAMLPADLPAARRDALLSELPTRWERLGDLALLPEGCLVSSEWADLGPVLWQAVAGALGVSRQVHAAVRLVCVLVLACAMGTALWGGRAWRSPAFWNLFQSARRCTDWMSKVRRHSTLCVQRGSRLTMPKVSDPAVEKVDRFCLLFVAGLARHAHRFRCVRSSRAILLLSSQEIEKTGNASTNWQSGA